MKKKKKKITEEEKIESLWKVLPAGFFIINGLTAIAMLIAILLSGSWSMGICLVLSLITMIGGSVFIGPSAIFASILSFLGIAMATIPFPEYLEQMRGGEIRDLPVREVLQYPKVTRFYFQDAYVALPMAVRYTHTYYVTNSTTKTREKKTEYYYLAPIFDTEQATNTSVTAWAACKRNYRYKACENWQQTHSNGLRIGKENIEYYDKAINIFKKKFPEIKIAKTAPFLKWTDDPMAEIESTKEMMIWAVVIINGIWLITMPVYRLLNDD